MTIRLAAGALLCALAGSAVSQAPGSLPTFRDRKDHARYWQFYAPTGFDSLRLVPTADKHGAVSQLRYMTSTGVECEMFVAGGQWISGRVPHPRLHRRPPVMVEMLVPEEHGGLLTLPMVPSCPVLKERY